MELRPLRYFLTVAKEQSFTKAAEQLHITQPTLSRQMAAFEEELRVTLLIRNGKKISLTLSITKQQKEIFTQYIDAIHDQKIYNDWLHGVNSSIRRETISFRIVGVSFSKYRYFFACRINLSTFAA